MLVASLNIIAADVIAVVVLVCFCCCCCCCCCFSFTADMVILLMQPPVFQQQHTLSLPYTILLVMTTLAMTSFLNSCTANQGLYVFVVAKLLSTCGLRLPSTTRLDEQGPLQFTLSVLTDTAYVGWFRARLMSETTEQ